MTSRSFKDFEQGQVYRSKGSIYITKDDIVTFAEQFDPQSFHLSEEGGEKSIFGQQVASGWHTAALSMRLMTMSEIDAQAGLIGLAVRNMTWKKPVIPGDFLHSEIKILETVPSQSNPVRGKVNYHITTFNQNNEPVFEMEVLTIVPIEDR